MTLLGLLNISALTLFVLVLASVILRARAYSRGFFGSKNLTVDPSLNIGLCASSISIHGYKCQEIEITTKDGYILSLQRIPEGRSEVSGNMTKKEPVIVQHGIMVDGQVWLLNAPEHNLPLILADNGLDVWIVNSRGTRYSRKHTSLDASKKKYWDWSWDELVTYEMPAIFDYVSTQTGQKVNYVGHSMGTLVPLVAFSEGKLVNQLKAAALLSPVAYLSHMGTPLGVAAAKSLLGESVALMGIAEFNPTVLPVVDFIKGLCAQNGINCNDMFTLVTAVRSGALKKFDFERPQINFLHYRQLSPPIYNLSNIPPNLPIFMSYGGKDALSDVEDVKTLLEHLKNHDADKLSVQFIKNYAHADYVMAVNAKDLVYNDVVQFLKRKF